MLLSPGEKAIHTEPIPWTVFPGNPIGGPGQLYLTDRRIVFEASYVAVGHRTRMDFDLRQISNVQALISESGQHVLMVESGQWSCMIATPTAPDWVNAIVSARHARISAFEQAQAAQARSAQETAKPMVLLHCKHCGTLNSVNPAGNFHCTSCGATL